MAKCYHEVTVSQPVKLSDTLVLDARLVGRVAERSIAGQIEYWANLGRAVEPLLQGAAALALARSAATLPLSACLDSVDSPEGARRLEDQLRAAPWPHYEPAGDASDLVVRIEADGRRTVGRFVNRQFQPAEPPGR